MCQQAVEKALKACYVGHYASTPPYTHNLLRLTAELPWKGETDARMMGIMERLNSYYIESRYTEDIQELAAVFTEAEAKELFKSTSELFAWIKAKL